MQTFKTFFENLITSDVLLENITLKQDETDQNIYILDISTVPKRVTSKAEISTQIGSVKGEKPILYRKNINVLDLRDASPKRIRGDVWALFTTPDIPEITNIFECLKTIFREYTNGNVTNPIEIDLYEMEKGKTTTGKEKTIKVLKKRLVKYDPKQLTAFIDYAAEGAVKFMTTKITVASTSYENIATYNKEFEKLYSDLQFDIIINIKSSSPLNKLFKDKILEKLNDAYKNKLITMQSADYALTIKRNYPEFTDTEEKLKAKIQQEIDKFTKETMNIAKINVDDFIFKGDFKRVLERSDAISVEPSDEEISKKKEDIERSNPIIKKENLQKQIEEWKVKYRKDKEELKKEVIKTYKKAAGIQQLDMKKMHTSVRPFFIDFLDIDINRFTQEELDNMMNKRVLVIDDVITSSSTMADTIRQLATIDPKSVTGLVLFK